MKPIHVFLFISGLLSLTGCSSLVQEVDPGKVPTATAKLVIHCYISPQDTVITVVVEAPRAIIGLTDTSSAYRKTIANATVSLSDGSKTVRLLYSAKDLLYRISPGQLPILTGKIYTLNVAAPNYAPITAQCTVPVAVAPAEVRVDTVRKPVTGRSGFYQLRLYARLFWQDPVGQPNYYQVTGYNISRSTSTLYNSQGKPIKDSVYTRTSQLYFNKSNYLTDEGNDGVQLSSARGEVQNFYINPADKAGALSIYLTLNTTDALFYKYRDAVSRQADAGNNPFSEAVLIPSNIQNGLGCFAAFNQATLSVKVR
ncbi:DUF4249 domain-containing protein [Fibrella sp. HMF5335]|uniref:DUF4249 domain-containing protein n=1 Tax=Fibrella rubiginis TaxID=2817060 RepID=A0A939K5X9_9BACT|nr:DUF4249 domain-containing protein [Fibrella rubiginis]MBO0939969.1 DUF4249 domain-containing protein [Fibrella rubiginis]